MPLQDAPSEMHDRGAAAATAGLMQRRTPLDWNDLRYFLEVARLGSVTQAAQALGTSQATVARRVAALEEDLKTKLFVRHQNGYVLTDEGRAVLAPAKAAEEGVLATQRAALRLESAATGVVRLATSENLAADVVVPALPRFAARHPGLGVEILTGTSEVTLGRGEADLALRLVRPSLNALKVRRVGRVTYSLYCSEAYLRRTGRTAQDPLESHSLITWDAAHAHLPSVDWLMKRAPSQAVLASSSLPTQVAAVVAGLGVAVLPDFVARTGFVSLAAAGADWPLFSRDMWLVTHADVAPSPRVRALSEFLVATLAEDARFRGD